MQWKQQPTELIFHCFHKCKIVQSYIKFEPFTSRSSVVCTLKKHDELIKAITSAPCFFFLHLFEEVRPERWAKG